MSISLSVTDICPKKVVYRNVVERMCAHDWEPLFELMLNHRVWSGGSGRQLTADPEMACKSLLIEYLRFILCKVHLSDFELRDGVFQLATCKVVDDLVWHQHLMLPRDYYKFCTSVIGEVIDHNPLTKDMPNWAERYQRTLDTYRELLGMELTQFWTRGLSRSQFRFGPAGGNSASEGSGGCGEEEEEGEYPWDFIRDRDLVVLREPHGSREIQMRISSDDSAIEGAKFTIKNLMGNTHWCSLPDDPEMNGWDLKWIYQAASGIPVSQVRMIADGGKQIANTDKLLELGIKDGSNIVAILKLRGC